MTILRVMLNVIMLNVVMLNAIMLNVFMLSVIMLNVIMLNVVAPILKASAYSNMNRCGSVSFQVVIHILG
jgi:hypothetical protein